MKWFGSNFVSTEYMNKPICSWCMSSIRRSLSSWNNGAYNITWRYPSSYILGNNSLLFSNIFREKSFWTNTFVPFSPFLFFSTASFVLKLLKLSHVGFWFARVLLANSMGSFNTVIVVGNIYVIWQKISIFSQTIEPKVASSWAIFQIIKFFQGFLSSRLPPLFCFQNWKYLIL